MTIGSAVKYALGAIYRGLGLAERAQRRRDRREQRNAGRTEERADQQGEVLEDIEYAKRADDAFDRLTPAERERLQRRNAERRSRRS